MVNGVQYPLIPPLEQVCSNPRKESEEMAKCVNYQRVLTAEEQTFLNMMQPVTACDGQKVNPLMGGNCDFCGESFDGKFRVIKDHSIGQYYVAFCSPLCFEDFLELPLPVSNGTGQVREGATWRQLPLSVTIVRASDLKP